MLSSISVQTSSSNCCFRSCTASRSFFFAALFLFSDFTKLFQSPLHYGPGVFIGSSHRSQFFRHDKEFRFSFSTFLTLSSTEVPPLLSLATRDLFPKSLRVLASSTCPERFDPHHQQGRTASQSSCAILSLASLHFSLSWLSSKLQDSSSPLISISGEREKVKKI